MRRSPLLAAVRKAYLEQGAPSAGQILVVGLSGGADSVALLDLSALVGRDLGFRVVGAHLDHGLRSGSAEAAASCGELCSRLAVPFRSARGDVRARAAADQDGVEAAARVERYAFLERVRAEVGAVAVAVAHTREDQAETVLLRLLRGSARTGLSAMRTGGRLLRPLLGVSHDDLREHLRARGLTWVEDPTNTDTDLLRNRVRHELLPYLRSRFNPRLDAALCRAAAVMADEDECLEAQAGELLARLARPAGPALVLSRNGLLSAHPALARRAVRRALETRGGLAGVGQAHVEAVLALARGPSGRRLPLPGRREARSELDGLCLGPPADAGAAFVVPLPVPGRAELPGGDSVTASPAPGPPRWDPAAAVVAAEGPLVVRTRRPGDRVAAVGREKSLRRFLMDRRVPSRLRDDLPLVASGDRVLWVPGEVLPGPPGAATGARFVRLEHVRRGDKEAV